MVKQSLIGEERLQNGHIYVHWLVKRRAEASQNAAATSDE